MKKKMNEAEKRAQRRSGQSSTGSQPEAMANPEEGQPKGDVN